MEQQTLEQTVQTLVTHLERSEQRYERSQRQFHLMSGIFALLILAAVTFTFFQVDVIKKVEAKNVLSTLQMDIHNLNTILSSMAIMLEDVNSPEARSAVSKIDDIIEGTHKLLLSAQQEKDSIAGVIRRAIDEMEIISQDMKGMTSDMSQMRASMSSMEKNFNLMRHDVHVMSVDMHHMSSTVTPTMGNMNNFMRFIPSP